MTGRAPLDRYVRRAAAVGALPDAWKDDEPRCDDCGRTLRPHKGHWTCVARGCALYGESQGDGAPDDDR